MLGTPPAFILSQDQTLVKSVCSVQESLLAILSLYCVWFRFDCSSARNKVSRFVGYANARPRRLRKTSFPIRRAARAVSAVRKISSKKFSRIVVYCSVIKVLFSVPALQRQLLHITKSIADCQELFLFYFPALKSALFREIPADLSAGLLLHGFCLVYFQKLFEALPPLCLPLLAALSSDSLYRLSHPNSAVNLFFHFRNFLYFYNFQGYFYIILYFQTAASIY